jgi:hypothetical protein
MRTLFILATFAFMSSAFATGPCYSQVYSIERSEAGPIHGNASSAVDGLLTQQASDTCGGANFVYARNAPNVDCWTVNKSVESCRGTFSFQRAVSCSSH